MQKTLKINLKINLLYLYLIYVLRVLFMIKALIRIKEKNKLMMIKVYNINGAKYSMLILASLSLKFLDLKININILMVNYLFNHFLLLLLMNQD